MPAPAYGLCLRQGNRVGLGPVIISKGNGAWQFELNFVPIFLSQDVDPVSPRSSFDKQMAKAPSYAHKRFQGEVSRIYEKQVALVQLKTNACLLFLKPWLCNIWPGLNPSGPMPSIAVCNIGWKRRRPAPLWRHTRPAALAFAQGHQVIQQLTKPAVAKYRMDFLC